MFLLEARDRERVAMDAELSQHQLTTPMNLPLRLDLRVPAVGTPRAGLLVCHGFKGFKDWGFFPYLSQRLAEAGFAVATFDFSLNGVGDRPGEFDRLDLFEANTFSQELADLRQVKQWLNQESPVADAIADKPLGLLGHSRGGVIVTVGAAEDPQVSAVVTWNGTGYSLRYTERQLKEWKESGRLEFVNARTGQRMAVGYGFVEDILANGQRFEPAHAAQEMSACHLILHAAKDLAVSPDEAEVLRAGRGEDRSELVMIKKTGHTFGAVHPFEGTTPALEQAIERTVVWFQRWL